MAGSDAGKQKPKESLGRTRLGGPTKRVRQKQKSPRARAEELQHQKQIFQLVVRGFTVSQIADQLGIGVKRAGRLQARAMDEYLADRDELVHMHMAKSLAQADAMLRTWIPRAMGYTKVDSNGNPIMKDGRPEMVDPDVRAGMLVARILRDKNMLIGYGVSVKVEHTGAGGGPIMTAHLDARAAAAMIRESFANAPQVILAEGESVEDAPKLSAGKH